MQYEARLYSTRRKGWSITHVTRACVGRKGRKAAYGTTAMASLSQRQITGRPLAGTSTNRREVERGRSDPSNNQYFFDASTSGRYNKVSERRRHGRTTTPQ